MEATFAFVDLAGFSALTETHGNDAAAELVGRFTAVVDASLMREATRVAVIGDAAFLVAPEPAAALRVVSRLWHAIESEANFPMIRAGLHHGEAVMRGTDYVGTAVNVAARVASFARGGQVVATHAVADAARSAAIAVAPLGPFDLKNMRGSVELFALSFASSTELESVDPVCRMRVAPDRALGRLRIGNEEYFFCSVECAATFAGEQMKQRPSD